MEEYKKLFDLYLKCCTKKYAHENPYDNLDVCCEMCNRYRDELMGMLTLLEQMNVITYEQEEQENKRIINTFSTKNLFNATVEKGEIYVWEKPEK